MNFNKNFGTLGQVKVETIPLENVEIFAKYTSSNAFSNRNVGPFNDDCNLAGSACYPETAILDGGVSGGSTTGYYIEPTLSPYP